MALSAARKRAIRRQYRLWRADVDLTQGQVEERARRIYPEFRAGSYWRIENGLNFPSPSERKALARVLKCDESALPADDAEDERATA